MRVLLANADKIDRLPMYTPIVVVVVVVIVTFFCSVCVCHTNHALDQFLEQMIDSDAVALSDVVRIGGQSYVDRHIVNFAYELL
jgi:fructose-specific phosphotransferase system IIC component